MSYESEFFAQMKDAWINRTWTNELHREQQRTFPKMTASFVFESENGEKYYATIVIDHEQFDIFTQVSQEAV